MSLRVMSWAFEESPTRGAERLVLLALSEYANDEGYCWPSMASTARKGGVTRRSVIRVIKRLESKGMLAVKRRWDTERLMPGTNLYRVCWTEAIRKAEGLTRLYNLAVATLMVDRGATSGAAGGSDTESLGSDTESLGVVTQSHQGSDRESLGVVTQSHQGSDTESLNPSSEPPSEPSVNRQLNHHHHNDPQTGDQLVVVVWNDAAAVLLEMGIWESSIPDFLTLAQTSGWTEQQLISLARSLAQRYERERACSLLKRRIESENPSSYIGYTQSPLEGGDDGQGAWFLPESVLCALEVDLNEDQLAELDAIAAVQGWTEADIAAMQPHYGSNVAFFLEARHNAQGMKP